MGGKSPMIKKTCFWGNCYHQPVIFFVPLRTTTGDIVYIVLGAPPEANARTRRFVGAFLSSPMRKTWSLESFWVRSGWYSEILDHKSVIHSYSQKNRDKPTYFAWMVIFSSTSFGETWATFSAGGDPGRLGVQQQQRAVEDAAPAQS